MDIARSAQALLKEIMLENARCLRGKLPNANLCLAGVVAAQRSCKQPRSEGRAYQALFVSTCWRHGGRGAASIAKRVSELATRYRPLVWVVPEFSLAYWRDLVINALHSPD